MRHIEQGLGMVSQIQDAQDAGGHWPGINHTVCVQCPLLSVTTRLPICRRHIVYALDEQVSLCCGMEMNNYAQRDSMVA